MSETRIQVMNIAKNEQKYSRHAPAMCHSQRYYISVYFLQYNIFYERVSQATTQPDKYEYYLHLSDFWKVKRRFEL